MLKSDQREGLTCYLDYVIAQVAMKFLIEKPAKQLSKIKEEKSIWGLHSNDLRQQFVDIT